MQLKNLALFAAGATAQMSICDKYTTALLKQNTGANQLALLSLLVNTAVIGNFTGPGTMHTNLPGSMVAVPGILAPGTVGGVDVNLAPYFSGGLKSTNINGKAGVMNFLDGGGADPILANPTSPGKSGSNQAMLLSHLYSYFGLLLGCTQVGKSGFPAYAGDPNMYEVHKFMDLSEAEFTYFVMQVGLSAQSFGASSADISTAAMALNSTFGYRCSPPASVVPGAPKQLQAICIDNTCPIATMGAVCGQYDAAVEPASVMATPMATPMPTPVASMPAGSTPAPISQITDGQPQATVPGQPMYSGAAGAVGAPGALLGLAGLAALAL